MAPRKIQRPGTNSLEGRVSAFTPKHTVPIPKNVVLRDEAEEILWNQFTSVRPAGDWSAVDLMLVGKLVRLESDIARYESDVSATSALIKNKRGTLIVNPLIAVIDTLSRRQLAVIRSMALTATASDSRTLAAHAAEAAAAVTVEHSPDSHATKTRQLIPGSGSKKVH